MSEIVDFLASKGIEWLKGGWEPAKERTKDEKWPPRPYHWCGTPDIMNRLFDHRKKEGEANQRGEKKPFWD